LPFFGRTDLPPLPENGQRFDGLSVVFALGSFGLFFVVLLFGPSGLFGIEAPFV
jgi:hypothetical protein